MRILVALVILALHQPGLVRENAPGGQMSNLDRAIAFAVHLEARANLLNQGKDVCVGFGHGLTVNEKRILSDLKRRKLKIRSHDWCNAGPRGLVISIIGRVTESVPGTYELVVEVGDLRPILQKGEHFATLLRRRTYTVRVKEGCEPELVRSQDAQLEPPDSTCLPLGLHEEISQKYPGRRVVSLVDLDEYHRQMFQKDHGARCPGLVSVNFYGDGKPTWALVLIRGENSERKAELVVARQLDEGWETRLLDSTDGTPVVWGEAPGEYEDAYGEKNICAPNPVIVFVGYESWAIVYAWTGKTVEKIWLSD